MSMVVANGDTRVIAYDVVDKWFGKLTKLKFPLAPRIMLCWFNDLEGGWFHKVLEHQATHKEPTCVNKAQIFLSNQVLF